MTEHVEADGHAFGWRRQLPDHRDHVYALAAPVPTPPRVDLRPKMPPVWNQGALSSCTGHAVGVAIAIARTKAILPYFDPSRLALYYDGRLLDGPNGVAVDAGAIIRDVVKQAAKLGVASEKLWPYDATKVCVQPTKKYYAEAAKHLVTSYQAVPQDLQTMRACLAQGFPIVFGFSVYASFENGDVKRTGIMTMPSGDDTLLGGHAVAAVGYDDAAQRFIIRNSWGAHWGDAGYFHMPYGYALNPGLAADFWTIRAGG